jgi:hypothetical protein
VAPSGHRGSKWSALISEKSATLKTNNSLLTQKTNDNIAKLFGSISASKARLQGGFETPRRGLGVAKTRLAPNLPNVTAIFHDLILIQKILESVDRCEDSFILEALRNDFYLASHGLF